MSSPIDDDSDLKDSIEVSSEVDFGESVQDDKPNLTPSTKKVAIVLFVLAIGLGVMIALMVFFPIEPTYIQTDYGLPHECMLHVFENQTGLDHIAMSCNKEWYNNQMFREIQGNITMILKDDFDFTGNATINPTPGVEVPDSGMIDLP